MLAPGLEAAGHVLVDELGEAEAMVDFTRPDVVAANVRAAVAAGVPSVVGTTGWDTEEFAAAAVTVFYAPNFALGAVLMIRFAEEAAQHLIVPRSSSCTTRRSSTSPRERRSSPRNGSGVTSRSTRCACRG